jgi:Flp pilus assembly protein TadG
MRNCRTNFFACRWFAEHTTVCLGSAAGNPTHANRRARGATTVETALVLPIVLLFMFGIFEYGRYFMTMQLLNNAAREGARYAIAHLQPVTLGPTTYGNSTSDVTNVINGITAGVTLNNQAINVYASDAQGNNLGTWTSAIAGQSVTVQITGDFRFMTAAFLNLPSTIAVDIKSAMDAEGN